MDTKQNPSVFSEVFICFLFCLIFLDMAWNPGNVFFPILYPKFLYFWNLCFVFPFRVLKGASSCSPCVAFLLMSSDSHQFLNVCFTFILL
jgi:hypothetical protein